MWSGENSTPYFGEWQQKNAQVVSYYKEDIPKILVFQAFNYRKLIQLFWCIGAFSWVGVFTRGQMLRLLDKPLDFHDNQETVFNTRLTFHDLPIALAGTGVMNRTMMRRQADIAN